MKLAWLSETDLTAGFFVGSCWPQEWTAVFIVGGCGPCEAWAKFGAALRKCPKNDQNLKTPETPENPYGIRVFGSFGGWS